MKPLSVITFCVSLFLVTAAQARQSADPVRGKKTFAQCAACHDTGDRAGLGPGLRAVVGRKAGSLASYRYSAAMQKSNIVWDASHLDAYVAEPQRALPGTKMPFAGMRDAGERADLIAYLKTLK